MRNVKCNSEIYMYSNIYLMLKFRSPIDGYVVRLLLTPSGTSGTLTSSKSCFTFSVLLHGLARLTGAPRFWIFFVPFRR